jgi:hypothetical protein
MKVSDVIKGGSIKSIISFLETSPDDEVYTVQELFERFGVAESTIKSSSTLRAFRTNFQGKNYFGSSSAITAFEDQQNED